MPGGRSGAPSQAGAFAGHCGALGSGARPARAERLVERLKEDPTAPLFVFGAGYEPIAIGYGGQDPASPTLTCVFAPTCTFVILRTASGS
jgi:hypothetical protein